MLAQHSNSPHPRGFTLLLSLLILMAVFAITALLSRVIFRDIGSARAIRDANLAYFTAESGIEQALYLVKRNRQDIALPNSLSITKAQIAALSRTVGSAGGTYEVDGATVTAFTIPLRENEIYSLDYLNPDNLNEPSNVDKVVINGQDADGTAPFPWLELSYVRLFDPNTGLFDADPILRLSSDPDPEDLSATRFAVNATCGTDACLPATVNEFSPAAAYRIRLKSLYDNAAAVSIQAFTAANAPVAPPGQISFVSTGTFPTGSATKQAIQASINWLTPSGPLFDYTLFSEQSLQKQ